MHRLAVCLLFVSAAPALGQGELPKMKFNDVREIAPGVFFRYSAISATDKSVVFGGSNNIWIVFDDYVLVYDANFPKEAGDVIEAVKKTTDKPIRYVLDSHHHGDHAYGIEFHPEMTLAMIKRWTASRTGSRMLSLPGAQTRAMQLEGYRRHIGATDRWLGRFLDERLLPAADGDRLQADGAPEPSLETCRPVGA